MYRRYYEEANRCYTDKDYEMALTFYDRAIRDNHNDISAEKPFLVNILYNKGTAFLSMARDDTGVYDKRTLYLKARFTFNTAIELSDSFEYYSLCDKLYFNLGMTAYNLGEIKQAYAYFLLADKYFKGMDNDTKEALKILQSGGTNFVFKSIH